MTRLVALLVGGETQPWEAVGFRVSSGSAHVADVELRFTGGEPGLKGWIFAHDTHDESTVDGSIDGIPTWFVSAARPSARSLIGDHVVVGLDHVVVNTSEPSRTCAAIESVLGLPVKRIREVGNGYEQRFHKTENMIIEVVSGPGITPGDARLWGLVASVEDLDGLASVLGDGLVSPPKPAVQPGRRIATVRGSAGLGVPFALMSPHLRRDDSPVV